MSFFFLSDVDGIVFSSILFCRMFYSDLFTQVARHYMNNYHEVLVLNTLLAVLWKCRDSWDVTSLKYFKIYAIYNTIMTTNYSTSSKRRIELMQNWSGHKKTVNIYFVDSLIFKPSKNIKLKEIFQKLKQTLIQFESIQAGEILLFLTIRISLDPTFRIHQN